MSIKSILTIILLLPLFQINAQPVIEWERSLGGSDFENVQCIRQTIDGGYVFAATSHSSDGYISNELGGYDFWIVKLMPNGRIEWEKSLGGSSFEGATHIEQTSDNGYIISGYSNSNDGDVSGNQGSQDAWVVRMTSIGQFQWKRTFGGSGFETATCIKETSDGGFVMLGTSNSNDGDVSENYGLLDVWVVKLNKNGSIEWEKSYGGSNNDKDGFIIETTDNGFVFAVSSDSSDGDVNSTTHGSGDIWVVKLNNIGVIEWEKSYGGSNIDYPYSIQQTADEGYVVAGYSKSSDGDLTFNFGDSDYWVFKLSNTGAIKWEKSYGGSIEDIATDIQQTPDGGYYVLGTASSNNGDVVTDHSFHNYWLLKLTSAGQIQWQKSLGGSGIDTPFSFDQTTEKGLIIAGTTSSSDGDVTNSLGGGDCWIIKLSFDDQDLSEDLKPLTFSIYPSPASNQLNIHTTEKYLGSPFTIYDLKGQSILSGRINAGITKVDIQIFSSGTYTIQINTFDGFKAYHFVKL